MIVLLIFLRKTSITYELRSEKPPEKFKILISHTLRKLLPAYKLANNWRKADPKNLSSKGIAQVFEV